MASPERIASLSHPWGGMDRPLPKRRVTWRLAAGLIGALLLSAAVYGFLRANGMQSYAVNADHLTVSTVMRGTFLDFVPIRGQVTPLNTVYLDVTEGGRVDRVLVEEGSFVEEGQPILELSNTALQLDVISRQAQISEQLNNLRNTRLAMEQNRLTLKSTLVEIDYQLTRLEKLAARRKELYERNLISRQDYEDAVDELEYSRNRRRVTIESQEVDERMRHAQLASLESNVEHLERNLEIARQNLDNLVIKAPISGQLTSLNAEVGESKGRGERLGQIDDIGRFKVSARVDEFYVTRLQPGQSAEVELAGESYEFKVAKVYPEVRDGQFEVDLKFVDKPPANLRRGQTLQIRVALGDPIEALLLARGGFFQDTGGNWAFVLDPNGDFAEKQYLRLGRRNPDYFEVLEGLEENDRVVTSTYASFAQMDRLVLDERE